MTADASIPVVLTVAGSDSGGGAGIQADLKTFFALDVFGTSAITCITAQNPGEVTGVMPVDPDMVAGQIRTVCAGFPVRAAKTGMLYSESIIRAVVEALKEVRIPLLVVDPVMVATSGARLLREQAVGVLCEELAGMATVLTPNVPEAEILLGRSIRSVDDLHEAAQAIGERFGTACIVKGGHLVRSVPAAGGAGGSPGGEKEHDTVLDVLYRDGAFAVESSRRMDAAETHGTGCTFSAALAAHLARGADLRVAFREARLFVKQALKDARPVGRHVPLRLQNAARAQTSSM